MGIRGSNIPLSLNSIDQFNALGIDLATTCSGTHPTLGGLLAHCDLVIRRFRDPRGFPRNFTPPCTERDVLDIRDMLTGTLNNWTPAERVASFFADGSGARCTWSPFARDSTNGSFLPSNNPLIAVRTPSDDRVGVNFPHADDPRMQLAGLVPPPAQLPRSSPASGGLHSFASNGLSVSTPAPATTPRIVYPQPRPQALASPPATAPQPGLAPIGSHALGLDLTSTTATLTPGQAGHSPKIKHGAISSTSATGTAQQHGASSSASAAGTAQQHDPAPRPVSPADSTSSADTFTTPIQSFSRTSSAQTEVDSVYMDRSVTEYGKKSIHTDYNSE